MSRLHALAVVVIAGLVARFVPACAVELVVGALLPGPVLVKQVGFAHLAALPLLAGILLDERLQQHSVHRGRCLLQSWQLPVDAGSDVGRALVLRDERLVGLGVGRIGLEPVDLYERVCGVRLLSCICCRRCLQSEDLPGARDAKQSLGQRLRSACLLKSVSAVVEELGGDLLLLNHRLGGVPAHGVRGPRARMIPTGAAFRELWVVDEERARKALALVQLAQERAVSRVIACVGLELGHGHAQLVHVRPVVLQRGALVAQLAAHQLRRRCVLDLRVLLRRRHLGLCVVCYLMLLCNLNLDLIIRTCL